MHYQIAVIGGGPGGYAAAIRASQSGARAVLVEKDGVGGTCLNRGCIPTKVLTAGISILHKIKKAGDFGIEIEGVSVDYSRLMTRKDTIVLRLKQGIEYLLNKNKVELISGTATNISPGAISIDTPDRGALNIECDNIIIATGSKPTRLIELEYDGDLVITSNEAINITRVPNRLIIIGGGVIGCEFASIYSALGSKVTLLEIMPVILPQMDKEISSFMKSVLKRQGIDIKTSVNVKNIQREGKVVSAELENGEKIEADKLLISIGRIPNVSAIDTEKYGIALGKSGEVLVNKKMETSVKGLYAVGDVTGKMQLAHVASAQAKVAVDNIMGIEAEMDYNAVPNCLYTYPEVGSVGITHQDAESKGIDFKIGKFPFIALGKAHAIGDTEGFVKIISESKNGRIIGMHIVCSRAADLIAEAALAINMNITVDQLIKTIHAHPTMSEAIMEAGEAVYGKSIHFS
jgi:dihydrolipoamide dehydrogenase